MENLLKSKRVCHYIEILSKCSYLQDCSAKFNCADNDKEALLCRIRGILDNIGNPEELTVAFFAQRSVNRFSQWNNNSTSADTVFFVLYNLLFWESIRIRQCSEKFSCDEVEFTEEDLISNLIILAYKYYVIVYNKEKSFYSNDKVKSFYNRIDEISKIDGDIHSYIIKSIDLQGYLEYKGWDELSINEKAINSIRGIDYITEDELNKDLFWNEFIKKKNLSNPADDIVIFSKLDYSKLPDKYHNFIDLFEACIIMNDHSTLGVDELCDCGQLAFAYKCSDYVIFSKRCLEMTQKVLESFSCWGQYHELLHFYNMNDVNAMIQKAYNKLMTYKVADLLCESGYFLPTISVGLKKGKKCLIPNIEIVKYGETFNRNNTRNIGDIDIAFYSQNKHIFYIVEYKNYQMYVSSKHLDTEIAKVTEKNTIEKVRNRLQFVNNYKREVIENLYQDKKIFAEKMMDIKVQAIILTSKPNLYYYLNKFEDIAYYDWIEFKTLAENNTF